MANNMLSRYETPDGIELLINEQTGEAFATPSGYARMSGLSVRAIQLRLTRGFKGANIVNVKTAGVQTVRGLQSTNIIPADIVFDWLLDDNLELAKAMGKAGATLYMHQIAGFKLPATEKPEPEYLPTTYEKVLAVISD